MSGRHDSPMSGMDGDFFKAVQWLERHIGRRILSGFFVLVPLAVTVLVLRFPVGYIDGLVRPLPIIRDKPYDFPGIGVVLALVGLYIVGALVASRLGTRVFNWQTIVFSKVPVVRMIYSLAKQTADALYSPSGNRFSRVVFLEWPRPGVRALGFVTGHSHLPRHDRRLLVVYIPTVPNPTSGNLAFVPEDDVVDAGLTVEEAMKVVFSGGIVFPPEFRVSLREGLPEPVSHLDSSLGDGGSPQGQAN